MLSPVLTTAGLLGAGVGLTAWLNRSAAATSAAAAADETTDSIGHNAASDEAYASGSHDRRYAEARRDDLP